MSRHSFAALFASATLVLAAGSALAQKKEAAPPKEKAAPAEPGDKAPAPTETKVAPADKKFVEAAVQGNRAEIALGQLAQEKSQTDSVKQFGQQMVEHHTAMNDKLTAVATTLGVTVPEGVSKKHQALQDKLAKQEGKKFDKAYITAMIQEHQAALKLFEKTAKSSKNEDVKKAAEESIPQIKEHLAKAKEVQTSLKGVAAKEPTKEAGKE